MAIKVRRGAIADLDTSQLKAGEWVLGTDTINNVGIAKAPSDVVWLATKDDVDTAKSKLDPSVSSGVLTFRKPSWKQLVNAPIIGVYGAAVVYQNRIHVFQGTNHYSFDGYTWEQESVLPKTVTSPIAVVYNNKIHLIDNPSGHIGHQSWDGTSWTQESTTGLNMILYGMNNACIYDGKLTVVSSRYGYQSMFTTIWQYDDDNGWVNCSGIGYNASFTSCCVYDGKIHYAGNSGGDSGTPYSRMRYAWDGSNNIQIQDMPYGFFNSMMLEYHGKIHFIGSNRTGSSYGGDCRKKHYTWDGVRYEQLDNLIDNAANCPAVVYNDKIYLFGCGDSSAANYRVYVYG